MSPAADRLESIDRALSAALEKDALDEVDSLLLDREAALRELVSGAGSTQSWREPALRRQEQLAVAFQGARGRVATSLKEVRERRSAAGGWRDADRPDARFLSEKV